MKSPLVILQQYFGYDNFRLEQANAIENVISIKTLVPVIILTGYAELPLAKESLKLG